MGVDSFKLTDHQWPNRPERSGPGPEPGTAWEVWRCLCCGLEAEKHVDARYGRGSRDTKWYWLHRSRILAEL